jgi:hypothetical protein
MKGGFSSFNVDIYPQRVNKQGALLYKNVYVMGYEYVAEPFSFLINKRTQTNNLTFSNIKDYIPINPNTKQIHDYINRLTEEEINILKTYIDLSSIKKSVFNRLTKDEQTEIEKYKDVLKTNYPFLYEGSNLIDKDIGGLSSIVPKNTIFYKYFYENGILLKTSLSGTLPFYDSIFIFNKETFDKIGLSLYLFYFVYLSVMLIRTDHSLLELILAFPIIELKIKGFKNVYDFPKDNINDTDNMRLKKYSSHFSQKNMWGLTETIFKTISFDLNEYNKINNTTFNINDITNILDNRKIYIKKICQIKDI